jgi:hypothetical protein
MISPIQPTGAGFKSPTITIAPSERSNGHNSRPIMPAPPLTKTLLFSKVILFFYQSMAEEM